MSTAKAFGFLVIMQLVATCFCDAPLEVPGHVIPQSRRMMMARNSVEPSCGPNQIGPICAEDCRTIMTCIGKQEPVWNSSCAAINSKTPFCVDTSCVSQSDSLKPECKNAPSSFQCTSEGTFPDPTDCTLYHYCSALDKLERSYYCPGGYNYNSLTKLCRRGPCQKLNCRNKNEKWVLFDGNKGYYGFCTTPPIMFKCEDEENYIFDLVSNKCMYNCVRSGNFVDRSNCTQYIICDRIGGRWNAIPQPCPENFKFADGKCIFGECTSEIGDTPNIPETPPSDMPEY